MKYIILIIAFLASIIIWNCVFDRYEKIMERKENNTYNVENFQTHLKDGNMIDISIVYAKDVNMETKFEIKQRFIEVIMPYTTPEIIELKKEDKLYLLINEIMNTDETWKNKIISYNIIFSMKL